MKRKSKQIRSTIPPISSKQTIIIDINKLIFEVKTHVCEKLPSQKKIIEGK
jgi:hypothetical protein